MLELDEDEMNFIQEALVGYAEKIMSDRSLQFEEKRDKLKTIFSVQKRIENRLKDLF